MYKVERLIDINAKSRVFRGYRKLLVIGRCIEAEHPEILRELIERENYYPLSVCLEAEHVNMAGFKLAGILARGDYEEVAVLTVDGSLHCTQLHWMVEEVFKIMKLASVKRRHFVVYKGKLYEVPLEAVKTSRFLYKVSRMLSETQR